MGYNAIKNKIQYMQRPSLLNKMEQIVDSLNLSERIVALALSAILLVSTLYMLSGLYTYVSTEVPASGGSFSELVVGTPRFINPLLALTDSDRDLVMLTYSGLMRPTGDGALVPDMAESYDISEDGKEYTFILKDELTFHDGVSVTADDVLFTIRTLQDPLLKSARRADWDGVQVEKLSDSAVRFILPQPYVPFLENTTIGILPKHLWEKVKISEFAFSNLNIKPVGSGPYKIDKISYNKSGIPKEYRLSAFDKFALGEPNINEITLTFLSSKDELLNTWNPSSEQAVSGLYFGSELLDGQENLKKITYPRIFAVFFNQDKFASFAGASVRKALDTAIDKSLIAQDVMGGHASILSSAIPPMTISGVVPQAPTHYDSEQVRIDTAKEMLEDAGWEYGPLDLEGDTQSATSTAPSAWHKDGQILGFSLATANTPELTMTAQLLKDAWAKLGVPVNVQIFEVNDLNQNVIRARDYDALLFGEVVGRSLDLFAFWHSSQRDDPGLNIALYANTQMDKLLEEARSEQDPHERADIYTNIANIMEEEVPAVFLYSPDFIYVLPDNIRGADMSLVATPSERFMEVYKWYIETYRVWNIFAK